MPAKLETRTSHKPSALEIILFLIVLATMTVLVIDFAKPFKQN